MTKGIRDGMKNTVKKQKLHLVESAADPIKGIKQYYYILVQGFRVCWFMYLSIQYGRLCYN